MSARGSAAAGRPSAEEWARWGAGLGFVSVAAYFTIVANVLPVSIGRFLFFALGPAIALAVYCLGRVLAEERDTPALRLAVLSHIVAAAMMSAMAVVQLANRSFMARRLEAADDSATRETLGHVFRGVENVQLGLDFAWDLWLVVGAALLAMVLVRHPGYGRAIGWTGVVAAGAVMASNVATFPDPPSSVGLVDLGPALAAWYAVVLVLTTRRMLWRSEDTRVADTA